jgi:hypothetical protein
MKSDLLIKLVEMLVNSGEESESPKADAGNDGGIYSKYVGKYVLCRTRNEGINFGKVKEASDSAVILEEAQRLHYFKPAIASESWYEGVSAHGITSDSRISMKSEKLIKEDYSLTLCTAVAISSIQSAPTHEQR